MAGQPVASMGAARGPGSASILRTIWRAVSTSQHARNFEGPSPTTDNLFVCLFKGGGCFLPLTPHSPIGEDCTALPGVADVACLHGECVVRRCLSGYVLSHGGTRCRKSGHGHALPHVSAQEEDGEYVQALRYGLEHRPLERN